jgi:hypothetical protein
MQTAAALLPLELYKPVELAAKFMESQGLMPSTCCPPTIENSFILLTKTVKTIFQWQRIYFKTDSGKCPNIEVSYPTFSYFCFAANPIMKNGKEITLLCPHLFPKEFINLLVCPSKITRFESLQDMTQIYPILPQSQKHNTFSFFSRL